MVPACLSFVSGVSLEDLRDPQARPAGHARRVWLGALGFIFGFSAVFVAIGASATAIGRIVSGLRIDLGIFTLRPSHLAGLVIVLFGLHLMGLLRLSFLYREQRFQPSATGGTLRAFLLGGAFAFGWTPCIGPVLAGILTIAAGQDSVGRGVYLLALYSLGLGVPFLLTALSLDRFYRVFAVVKRHFRAIEITSGVLLVVVGVMVMTDSLVILNSYFSFMTDWVLALEEALL